MPKRNQQFVDRAKPGHYTVGDNLNLKVGSRSKSYQVRFTIQGQNHTRVIGQEPGMKLKGALATTQDYRIRIAEGVNPFEASLSNQAPTFRQMAEQYIEGKRKGGWSAKTLASWKGTLLGGKENHCAPILDQPIDQISVNDVLAVLTPIWADKHPTAKKIRRRIEAVINYARFHGASVQANPAEWAGNLENAGLPERSEPEQHLPSLAWEDTPEFVTKLKKREGDSAKALLWTILTASRISMVTDMQFAQIDRRKKIWTTPVRDMKMKEKRRDHRVPLTDEMLAFVGQGRSPAEYVFKNPKGSKMTSAAVLNLIKRMGYYNKDGNKIVTHGFRNTFVDWCYENGKDFFPEEAIKAAIAHKTTGSYAAYKRGDMLDFRRRMMEKWQEFLGF